MQDIPDETIRYIPAYCNGCGKELDGANPVLTARRQEVVIPPIISKIVEHRTFACNCSHCGFVTQGRMPAWLTAPIQYGPSVSATVAYLSVYQYLPYHRMQKMMQDLFGLHIGQGTLKNLLANMAKLATPTYDKIGERLKASSVVGGDETGTRINRNKGWFHVWQNTVLTFIVAASTRGYKTTQEYFSEGFPKAVYVSDCWSAQLKTPAKRHQLCLAHLLRELANFEQALGCKLSTELKSLLKNAIELKHKLQPTHYPHPPPEVVELEALLDNILAVDTNGKHPKIQAFIKRLIKNRQSVLTFLYFEEVPFENNSSERAVRNVKVKNKVSGCFRSEDGASVFAILRSVIDTATKNTQDVFYALTLIAQTIPE